jgi:hypothetical protein
MSTETIDTINEPLLTLAQACRLLPSKPAPSTLWRWRVNGVKINGRVIRLRCKRVGGQWYTTQRDFAEFINSQTEAAIPNQQLPADRPESTSRRLRAAGLL